MKYSSSLEIQKPDSPDKSVFIVFPIYVATDNEAIALSIDILCLIDSYEPINQIKRSFETVQQSATKDNAKTFWRYLNVIADESLDPIENFDEFIDKIKKHSLPDFIKSLPIYTIKNILFVLWDKISQLATNVKL